MDEEVQSGVGEVGHPVTSLEAGGGQGGSHPVHLAAGLMPGHPAAS